jgi:inorganic pyrophosphatase
MIPRSDVHAPAELLARYQIEPFRSGPERLRQVAVAFTGAPRKHHRDADKILLVSDPFSQQGFVYEFRTMDLVYAEEMPNVALGDGSTVSMVRLWVRKGSRALRIVPFSVEDTAQHLAELW